MQRGNRGAKFEMNLPTLSGQNSQTTGYKLQIEVRFEIWGEL